jgi:hypothetical protein
MVSQPIGWFNTIASLAILRPITQLQVLISSYFSVALRIPNGRFHFRHKCRFSLDNRNFPLATTLLNSTYNLDQFNLILRVRKYQFRSKYQFNVQGNNFISKYQFPKRINFYQNPHHNHQPLKNHDPKPKPSTKIRPKNIRS